MPERFELEYTGEDGKKHRPVVIHRAILGSMDRFMAFLIEETKGVFPTWLAPTQVKILPISDNEIEYSNLILDKLHSLGYRTEVDSSNEKIGYKIRKAQLEKIPYMIVIGKNEKENNVISIRKLNGEKVDNITIDDFVSMLKQDVEDKSVK